jgi:hypothetical protein
MKSGRDAAEIALDPQAGAQAGVDTALAPSAVGELFGSLDKAIRAQRLYQPNNPVYQSFVAGLQKAFEGIFASTTSMAATVEEQGFRWTTRLFPAGEGRDSLSYLFYKDGIRVITFLPGFEAEVEKFLHVINRARSQDQLRGDEDMVTLLWQQEFLCFQYSYVDALADGLQVPQSTVPTLAGLELTLVPEGEEPGERPDRPPQAVPHAVAEGQPPVAGMVSIDDFEETLYFLDPGELSRLRVEVDLEMQRDIKRDVLHALFDRLEDGLPQWHTESLRILRQLLPVFLSGGDLQSATVEPAPRGRAAQRRLSR